MPAVEKRLIFNTGPYGDGPPLKIKILKSGFLHAREDQKIGPEPKFHAPRPSNGKDYSGQPKRGQFLSLDHMGTPLKNQNFENRASSCFKLAKNKPRAKMSGSWEFFLFFRPRALKKKKKKKKKKNFF